MEISKKEYQQMWEEFRDNIRDSTPIDPYETAPAKQKRMRNLEKPGNEELWFKYYFPDFASDEPALFHKLATQRIINNPEWYEVRNWSRELAKSTRAMLEDLYLMLVGHPIWVNDELTREKKRYKILISATQDAAELLLLPYKVNLEANKRIINDYGQQERIGSWTKQAIITKSGFAIKAFGGDNKPRGTKNKNVRPDIIDFDDFDTDSTCENEDLVDKAWNYATKACIGTRSISKNTIVRWNGNVIAENCCILRAREFAKKVSIVNIRDKDGKSTWPEKNTEVFIDRTLAMFPFSAQQSEFYNNPHTLGKAFKEVYWGKVPALNKFPYLVSYADPATSNKDKGKGNSKSSHKAIILMGLLDGVYYVIKAKVDQMKNSDFIDHIYRMEMWVGGKVQVYSYIENNTLQNPFYEQVFIPLFHQKSKEFRRPVSVRPDATMKPDKYVRIEGTLEPLNRLKCLIFNEAEKNDEDMKRLVNQLKSVSPRSTTMDGPDAMQGAVMMINEHMGSIDGVELFDYPENPYSF